MSDRLKTFTSNLIRFAAGERPSADKFNAAHEYLGRNIKDVFKAIGDLYGVGYPHLINGETHLTGKWNPFQTGNNQGRALDIVNLARLIGPASNLNPKQLEDDYTQIEEIIEAGVAEYSLKLPPEKSLGLSFTIKNRNDETYEFVEFDENFTNERQYKEYKNRSIILFPNKTTEELTITYRTNTEEYHGGANYLYSSFNVIPDPNQSTKLNITLDPNDSTVYIIDWSETSVEAQQSGLFDLETTSTAGEYNQGKVAKLPTWMWSGDQPLFEQGTIIPEGFLYVKNLTTNECYLSATYTYLNESSIKITGVTLCETDEYQVVTVGTDITTSIDDLRNKWFNHKHDGSFGEPRVSIRELSERFIAGDFGPSSIEGNELPMYLHRKGYQEDTNKKNADNSMIGDLALSKSNYDHLDPTQEPLYAITSGTFVNSTRESHKILLGSESCVIQEKEGALRLENNKELAAGLISNFIDSENVGKLRPSILLRSNKGSISAEGRLVEINSPTIRIANSYPESLDDRELFRYGSLIHGSFVSKAIEEENEIINYKETYSSDLNNLNQFYLNENIGGNTNLSNKPIINTETELRISDYYLDLVKSLKIQKDQTKIYRFNNVSNSNLNFTFPTISFQNKDELINYYDVYDYDGDGNPENYDSGLHDLNHDYFPILNGDRIAISTTEYNGIFINDNKLINCKVTRPGLFIYANNWDHEIEILSDSQNEEITNNLFQNKILNLNGQDITFGFFGNINITLNRKLFGNGTNNLFLKRIKNLNWSEQNNNQQDVWIDYSLKYGSNNNIDYIILNKETYISNTNTSSKERIEGNVIDLNPSSLGLADTFEIDYIIEEKIINNYCILTIIINVLNTDLSEIP